jgi:restriction system protein
MIAAATHAAFWQSHSGHQFEHELAKLFTRDGYDTKVTRGSGDGGIDIILRRSGRTTVVQCKQTKNPVGPAVARDLCGAWMNSKADDGILAVTGGVTSGVHQFFAGKPLRVMMDLSEILELHQQSAEPTAR